MIDSFNPERTGWARFSEDMKTRYRLARVLRPNLSLGTHAAITDNLGVIEMGRFVPTVIAEPKRVTFLMLNPSTADAFKPDPTVSRCCKFAAQWGADVLEVVNIFAFRSTYPIDLYNTHRANGYIGAGPEADEQILAACCGAQRVVAAWGNHGDLINRGAYVRGMLQHHGIEVSHFGLTKDGLPLHPLARGKSFVPYDRELTPWDDLRVVDAPAGLTEVK